MRVDSREPKHIARFFRKRGWPVSHKKFADCADIADDDLSLLFERKHRTDMVASVLDGRLFDAGGQCERLYSYCERHEAMGFVVFSGDIEESIRAYSSILRKQMNKKKPKGHKIPASWRIQFTAAQFYKYVSMIPWHYDLNVLWFLTEEESLEAIHFMLQELQVSDPYEQTLGKRRRLKSKRKKKAKYHPQRKEYQKKAVTKGSGVPVAEEDTYDYFVKLGLIDE